MIAVPIGHPDDITIRALRMLRSVSVIASESPLITQKTLRRHQIAVPVTSYGPGRIREKVALLLDRLLQGQDVALVSDSGTPVLYDPGHLLVDEAHKLGILVRTIPGPSALAAAVAVAGFPGDAVIFEGSLPTDRRRLTACLSQWRKGSHAVVCYVEAEHLPRLLGTAARVLPKRRIALAINLTKRDETILRGRARELLSALARLPRATDVTVVIEGIGRRKRMKTERVNTAQATIRRGGG